MLIEVSSLLFDGRAKEKASMIALQLVSAGLTDRGKQRNVNEDAIFNHNGVTEAGRNYGLYIVCDGLGGHRAGDVASRTAIRTVTRELQSILPPSPAHHLSSADINQTIWTAVQKANEKILNLSPNGKDDPLGMGTTLTMAVIIDDIVHLAQVGDSRLYLLRDGKLTQLTHDHTMAAALAEAGQISFEEVNNHPRQNILLKAVGRQTALEADLMEVPLIPGDKLLICSDGFYKAYTGDVEILERRLNSEARTADLCKELLEEAVELDGSDNVSLIIVSTFKLDTGSRRQSDRQRKAQRIPELVPM
jgi:protein phosphatase